MSTKTLRKRIALVAVSAMGAGLLSVTAVSTASAAIAVRDLVGVTTASATNYGVVSVTNTSTSATTYEMLTTGQLALTGSGATTAATAGDYCKYAITQGTGSFTYITNSSAGGGVDITGSLAADGQSVTWTSDATKIKCGVAIYFKPGAAGKVVILYTKLVGATVSTVETITVNVLASAADSKSQVLDLGKSYLAKVATCAAATSNVDNSTDPIANGGIGYIGLDLMDSAGGDLASGAIQISATNGALVAWNADPTSASSSSAVAASAGTGQCIGVKQAVANKSVTTTVTISYNGTVVGSRSFVFTGDIAKIKVGTTPDDGLAINPKNATTATGFKIWTYDDAGNQIAYAVAADTSKYTPTVTAVTVTTPTTTASAGVDGGWTCANVSDSSIVRIKATNALGATVYSNDFTAACAGGVDTYTAKLDKPSYVPGDVATLTVTAIDSKGKPVKDAATVGANVAIAGSNMTAVTAAAAADTFTQGVKKYKFIVGSTEGSYQMTVDLPAYAATDSAKTVAYKISSGSASVTNAEVLAAIVKLIASINKQIAALQKALMKK